MQQEPPKKGLNKTQKIAVVAVVVVVAVVAIFAISPSLLSPARGISGHWEGTATYYTFNIWGERALRVNATCEMDITLNGNQVTGTISLIPVSQTPIAESYIPEPEEHFSFSGTYESTTLTFHTGTTHMGYTEWEFEFLTDMATGQITNLDTYYYLGLDSDAGAIHIARA